MDFFFLPRLLAKNENPIKEYKTHPFLPYIFNHNSCFGKESKINHLSFKGFHNYNTPKITSTHKSYYSVTDFLVLKSKDPLSECLRSSKHHEKCTYCCYVIQKQIYTSCMKTLLPIFF